MYMIMIFDDHSPDPCLVPYTGAVYSEKKEVIPEYNEACEEVGSGKTYVVFV